MRSQEQAQALTCSDNIVKVFFTLSLMLLLVACPGSQQLPSNEKPIGQAGSFYTVKKVLDGDSLIATRANRDLEIRLYGIDAPEHGQPFAREAKTAASRLLNGQTIRVVVEDTDRYRRAVAWVFLKSDKVSVNAQLVEQGMAWVYRRYTSDNDLIEKEKYSKSKRLGLWALPPEKRIPPWDWRKNQAN